MPGVQISMLATRPKADAKELNQDALLTAVRVKFKPAQNAVQVLPLARRSTDSQVGVGGERFSGDMAEC